MPISIIGSPITQSKVLSLVPVGGTSANIHEMTHTLAPPVGLEWNLSAPIDKVWDKREKPSLSWRQARKNGIIVMRNMSCGKARTEFFSARIPHHDFYYLEQIMYSAKCSTNQLALSELGVLDMHIKWDEIGDIKYWKDTKLTPFYPISIEYSDVIEKQKTAVLAKLNSSYDLLTELAEGKESIRLIVSLLNSLIHPLQTFKKEKEALYKSFHRGEIKTYSHLLKRVADAWMTYRYGIGPIIMSIQDIMKVLKLKDSVFHTERTGESIDVSGFDPTILLKPEVYLAETATGKITVRAVGKDGYSVGSTIQVVDLIGFNPILTAWEKIPYSFVVDWALNVGDYLNGITSSLTQLSDQRVLGYSVKRDFVVETRLHWDKTYTKSFGNLEWLPFLVCDGKLLVQQQYSKTFLKKEAGSAILQKRTESSYDFVKFSSEDLSLVSELDLNWKRILDSIALSINQCRKRISRLR